VDDAPYNFQVYIYTHAVIYYVINNAIYGRKRGGADVSDNRQNDEGKNLEIPKPFVLLIRPTERGRLKIFHIRRESFSNIRAVVGTRDARCSEY